MTCPSVTDSYGFSGPWPSKLLREFSNGRARVTLTEPISKGSLRELDAWAAAFVAHLRTENTFDVRELELCLQQPILQERDPNIEAFRRRVSFLNIVNDTIQVSVTLPSGVLDLYKMRELFDRPEDEVIRSDFRDRDDTDPPQLLEKAFQAFLFGKGQRCQTRTNDRLAILGEDFYRVKGKEYGIIREFPTGAFQNTISKETRLTPTEYVDIITLNKWQRLAVIELKLDDPKLEVLSQLLDYALFFRCYLERLMPLLISKLGREPANAPFSCYVVNNHFHPRFDAASILYRAKAIEHGFHLVKLMLGHKHNI